MYYVGNDSENTGTSAGVAFSDDGLTWEKYDDPATTEAPVAESDPIFVPQDNTTWEYNNIQDVRVMQTPTGWAMLYSSMNTGLQNSFAGYNIATSKDGIQWTRISDDALWTHRSIQRRPTWTANWLNHEGTYYVYMEIARGYQGDTDIFMGILEGSIWSE